MLISAILLPGKPVIIRPEKGAGGSGNGIEQRLGAVENRLEAVASDISALKNNVGEIKKQAISQTADIAEIKGRLTGAPNTLQWLGIIITMIFTIMGGSFALIRFGVPH